jgi:hypothetical protein
MRIILNETQFTALEELICNDQEYLDFVRHRDYNVYNPFSWIPFIKEKYKIQYRTSEDEYSEIYYGSLYGTKNRITMFLLRL